MTAPVILIWVTDFVIWATFSVFVFEKARDCRKARKEIEDWLGVAMTESFSEQLGKLAHRAYWATMHADQSPKYARKWADQEWEMFSTAGPEYSALQLSKVAWINAAMAARDAVEVEIPAQVIDKAVDELHVD